MRKRHWLVAGVAVAFALAAAAATAAIFPDSRNPAPAGWTGPVFRLSQDYPKNLPSIGAAHWRQIDFRTQPMQYLDAVLNYVLAGNVAVDFRGQDNRVRKWYHAPWMHMDPNSQSKGREFIRGLTRERPSRPGELHPNQTSTFQNWAVSMYNARGGYVLGRVWQNPNAPDPTKAKFPEATVALKLLFTRATVAQVPILANSLEWQADINRAKGTRPRPTLRLLQVDVAVRDKRADSTTGWVFGTFVYNGNAPGTTVWDRLVPVGLMWGNDPDRILDGRPPVQTFINPAALSVVQHLGKDGRLNGPVDNPESSCLSCHSTAEIPPDLSGGTAGGAPPDDPTDAFLQQYFRNIKAQQPFTPGRLSLDYSLQLQNGIVYRVRAGGLATPPGRSNGRTRSPILDPSDGIRVQPVLR